jgi:hypothetical protein
LKLALKVTSICLALLPSAVAWGQASVNESEETSLLYVNTSTGSDSNPGTQAKPFKTLTKGVDTALSQAQKGIGTRVTVEPGTYRESISVSGSSSTPVTIEAATAGTVVVSGADVWTGWQAYASNSHVFTHSWPYRWGFCPQEASSPEPNIVLRREMIFVNGSPLTQVLSQREMTTATFFVNESSGTVYIWPPSGTNMTSATVEVSTRPSILKLEGVQDWVLRGLTFQYGNSCRQTSAVTVSSTSNILIDTDKFLWNNAEGLDMSGVSHITVENSVGNHNGEEGLQGYRVYDGLWKSDTASYNDWRGAQGAYYVWNSAGSEMMSVHNNTYQDFTTLYNLTFGMHFDTDNLDITMDSLLAAQNFAAGIEIEKSQGPFTISGSDICKNNLQGQYFPTSIARWSGGVNLVNVAYFTLNSDTLYENGFSQIAISGATGGQAVKNYQTGATTQVYNENMTATQNTIFSTGSQNVFQDPFLAQDWSRFVDSLDSNDNTWGDPNESSLFMLPVPRNDTKLAFSAWKSATKQDSKSSFTTSALSSPASCEVTPDAADYWFVVNSSANTVSPGADTSFTFTAVPIGSFAGSISLTADVSQIPDGKGTWSSGSINTSGSSTLTIATSSSTSAGTYPVTVVANSGNLTRTVTVAVTVK